jgi:RimJ/RimL family protein N-acetyltransferase
LGTLHFGRTGMRLELDDLVIAPLAADDIPAFVAYRRDPDVARYQSWSPEYSDADGRRLVESQAGLEFPEAGEWMQFAIRSSSGELLGDVAVHVLDDLAERGAHRVILTLDERNVPMRRVCVGLGLRLEGTARDADWFKGEWTTVETWAVLGSEWRA